MIWALDDWDAMTRRIFAEVWVTMRIAYAWPRSLHPAPRHTSHALGRRFPTPLPRSWLGGRSYDPPRSAHPHTHLRTHTP